MIKVRESFPEKVAMVESFRSFFFSFLLGCEMTLVKRKGGFSPSLETYFNRGYNVGEMMFALFSFCVK
jgi:hypothetical protein